MFCGLQAGFANRVQNLKHQFWNHIDLEKKKNDWKSFSRFFSEDFMNPFHVRRIAWKVEQLCRNFEFVSFVTWK